MSQVSKRKLDKKVYERIFELLIASFAIVDNKNKSTDLINNLLTGTEKIMLAKRISIAYLLTNKYSYTAIRDILKVSQTTIWLVKNRIVFGGKSFEQFLKELTKKESPETYGLIEVLEDLFPPRYGTNWKEARRKQWLERKSKEKAF